ncbi:MAG: carboxypeptidase-like regulatory domain-containing protein [Tannerella sp.]|nr:carboxypeptidase-like regulatory domain-containing protein [Tannerella sp.]
MNQINILLKSNKINILLFVLLIMTTATAQNKTVTIHNKNISMKDAFQQIEKQTGYSIAYEHSSLNTEKKITLSLENAAIDDAIKLILKDTKHTYKITGYHIIISLSREEDADKKQKKPTQTIRGIVLDSKTNTPIELASVGIPNSTFGAITDSLGQFRINHVPVGRYNLQASYIGYNVNIIHEIPVTSSKEVYLKISLNENIRVLDEVLIFPETKKDELVNSMAITGGRMISMEEANRFANGFDDPARLSTAFAGVAGNVGTNALAVRGNSPQFTQWRLEGVEIPNPSHFAEVSGLGGGFFSALSTQVIGNSDFYNGAFPAEYGNALSGVFDIHMRSGNNQKYEHTFQFGLLGIDLASEGPISKRNGSSYIFNYRFSTTSLATGGDANARYQDLAFKLNFPTKRAGTFSFWGLGLIDKDKGDPEDRTKWETHSDRQSGKNNLEKMSGGLTHQYPINENTYLRSSLSATYANDRLLVDQHTTDNQIVPVGDIRNSKWDFAFNSYINKKFSSKHTNRTGITITKLNFDLDYQVSPDFGLDAPMERISKGDGNSTALSAFSTSVIDLTNSLTASIGINTQYFALNKNWTIEPRAALKWKLNQKQDLAVAYGLHSRRERLDYYFIERNIDGETKNNKYLDFSKAHHFGLTYSLNINQNLHLKIEPYYQYLFDIPVEENSSFSIINQADIYLDRILKNDGLGRNYGIDFTLEQYIKNGFYYMLTGSLFKSEYRGGDHIWRSTRYDRGYLFNVLAGKEWMVGKQKQNVFSINGRIFYHGGDHYTPIDEEKSKEAKDIIWDETKAFSKQFNAAINGDISVNYRINKRKVSHEFSLKILNIGGKTGMHYYEYNEKGGYIKKQNAIGVIPNISYKIYF